MSEKYDPFIIFKKNRLLNLATAYLLIGGVLPFILGFLGVYNSKDIASVLGVSARRGLFAFLEETKSSTVSICEARFGEKACTTDTLKLQKGEDTTTTP